MNRVTILDQVRGVMSDWQWHGVDDFISIGISYRNRISEWNLRLAAEAHEMCIASHPEKDRATYKYKLAKRKDCLLIPMQNGSRYQIKEGTLSFQEINLLTH